MGKWDLSILFKGTFHPNMKIVMIYSPSFLSSVKHKIICYADVPTVICHAMKVDDDLNSPALK